MLSINNRLNKVIKELTDKEINWFEWEYKGDILFLGKAGFSAINIRISKKFYRKKMCYLVTVAFNKEEKKISIGYKGLPIRLFNKYEIKIQSNGLSLTKL